jgi:hypothetical protein
MGVRLKRLKMVSTYIWVDTIASSDGVRKVCCPDGYGAEPDGRDRAESGVPNDVVRSEEPAGTEKPGVEEWERVEQEASF